ncbi:MAG: class I SAM-dependent methyltransferase [Myxococcota bacterium]
MTTTSTTEQKQKEQTSWTKVAPGWAKWDEVLTRCAQPVSTRMLELAAIGEGQQVLDIASGTGEPALAIGSRVGPKGSVLATDFVEPMLAFAREKAKRKGVGNVVFQCVDGEALDVPASHFDAVTIRWGLMFMPDPLACLRRCLTSLKKGGRIAAACWAEPPRNPWASLPAGILRKKLELPAPPPGAPGIFAFADPKRLTSVVEEAGFRDVQVVEQQVRWGPFESVAHAFTFISELAGPVATMLGSVAPQGRSAVEDEIRTAYAGLKTDGPLELPGVTWVVSGVRA